MPFGFEDWEMGIGEKPEEQKKEWCFTCGNDCTCDQEPAYVDYDLMQEE